MELFSGVSLADNHHESMAQRARQTQTRSRSRRSGDSCGCCELGQEAPLDIPVTGSREEFEEFLDGTVEAREIDRTGHAADASLIRVLP